MRKLASALSLAASYLFLLLMVIFVLLPVIYIVGVSFNRGSALYSATIIPRNATLENYAYLFQSTGFPIWYGNTIKVGVFNAIFSLCLVTPTAYAFSRLRFRGRKNYLIAFLVLQMFPGTMAMVAYFVLLNLTGLLNNHLGLVLIYSGTAVPGFTWLLKGYFDTVPQAIEEAAILDGASYLTVLARIIVPLTIPMLMLIAIFAFVAPFGDYILARIVLTTPDNFTLPLGIYNFIAAQFGKNFTMFAACSLLTALPITILYLAMQKTITTGFSGSLVR